ncbi:conserved hypothetical protein [Candida tropicalis MYA-3404]|uniref:DUF1776-domain-containing protein n=1 Tax=Candida tropicalis (strain ATCC MYA-3404 / T1) TaxID=294747 RepID=C5M3P5_CANTT|nr:conserved hypothetical protein [Candida tropicalis MYA-3404]EER35945.1 conserved hypothetical protein [Candida tropicalis MYA-3404]KAG4410063.1 hypothetical protein JTP64_000701 [Candida tropicalis]
MVADPVQATVQTLKDFYRQANHFLEDQQDKITKSPYYDKVVNLTKGIEGPGGSIATPPKRPPPPGFRHHSVHLWNNIIHSISHNKLKYASVFTVGLGITIYYLTRSSKMAKRRVPKLANGARRDVVLIIGSPTEPLTRSIAVDFEKRGFIVYMTLLDMNDVKYVESNKISNDLNYININDSKNMDDHIFEFNQILKTPIVPFPNANPHYLQLKAVIFTPGLHFPVGPIENMAISSWVKLSDRLLTYVKLFSSGLIQTVRSQDSKIILLSPNIVSGLSMPYYGPETVFQQNLKSLFTVLTRELASQDISVTQVRLGNLHLSNQRLSSTARIESLVNSEVRAWTSEMKGLYGNNFSNVQFKANPLKSSGGKGTNLVVLYHLLFDLIYNKSSNPAVLYCGTGARLYDWISKLLPESWVQWLLK